MGVFEDWYTISEVCKMLSISDTALSKKLKKLKKEGIEINKIKRWRNSIISKPDFEILKGLYNNVEDKAKKEKQPNPNPNQNINQNHNQTETVTQTQTTTEQVGQSELVAYLKEENEKLRKKLEEDSRNASFMLGKSQEKIENLENEIKLLEAPKEVTKKSPWYKFWR